MWSALAALAMTRADHLVALGGGVVGDLAGFCAATYQRGIPVVQVPTSLVAQVDSAYGGKTGVDLRRRKNYVGAFHQPAGVLVDPDTLETLPAAELAAGYAEVLKTALIAGGSCGSGSRADAPIDERVILDCVRCKLAIVAQRRARRRPRARCSISATRRPRDRDRDRLRPLSATARRSASACSPRCGFRGADELREQVAELMRAHGLPIRPEGVDPAASILAASRRDKKRPAASVPFVLVDGPGRRPPRRRAAVRAASWRPRWRQLLPMSRGATASR